MKHQMNDLWTFGSSKNGKTEHNNVIKEKETSEIFSHHPMMQDGIT